MNDEEAIDAVRNPRAKLDDASTAMTEYLAAVGANRYTVAVKASEQTRIRALALEGGVDLSDWPE